MEMKDSVPEKLSVIRNSVDGSRVKHDLKDKKVFNAEKKARAKEFNSALQGILRQYSNIDKETICFAYPVYYPIAMLEITMEEKTFEDFDEIEHDLLQFIRYVGSDAQTLSLVTGLDESYINKMIRSMHGMGLLKDGSITPIGDESLKKGMRIRQISTGEQFQMDAVNLKLLHLNELFSESVLERKHDTDETYGLVPSWSDISISELDNKLQQFDTERFIKKSKEIARPNIIEIKSKRCKTLKYARGYLLGFKSSDNACDVPVIFARRKIKYLHSTNKKDRLVWLPFSVPDSHWLIKYELPDDIPTMSSEIERIFYSSIRANQKDYFNKKRDGFANTKNKYLAYLETINLDVDSHIGLDFRKGDMFYDGLVVDLYMDTKLSLTKWLLHFINDLDKSMEVLHSDPYWKGGVVLIRAGDEVIRALLSAIKIKINEHGMDAMLEYFEEYLPEKDAENGLEDKYPYSFADMENILKEHPLV